MNFDLSPEAKKQIQNAAQRTGVSEEQLIVIYWSGYCDGILALTTRQMASMQKQPA